MTGVISWLATWLITLLLLGVLAKSAAGRTIVYYLLWLAIVLLLVTHADEISSFYNLEALQLNG